MKYEDLGFNLKTGCHDKRLTIIESCFIGILWEDHIGANNKVSANELAVKFSCAMDGFEPDKKQLLRMKKIKTSRFDQEKRKIRRIHNHLLTMHDNISIFSKAGHGGGYWIAENKEEAVEFYDTFRKRGMTGLVKASRGKKAVLVDMMEQVTFEFEDLAATAGIVDNTGVSGDSAAIAVVDSFLARMLESPERFSAGLKKLSKKYGSILLDKTEVAAMKTKAAELSRLVESLGV